MALRETVLLCLVSINTSETWHGHGNFSLTGIETEPRQRTDIIPREQLEINQPFNNYIKGNCQNKAPEFSGFNPSHRVQRFFFGGKEKERGTTERET